MLPLVADCVSLVLTQVPLSRSLMGDAAAVKAIQSNPLQALASADRGGLVCAACNGTWICPRYKDMLYVCLGSVVGASINVCPFIMLVTFRLADQNRNTPS